MINEIVMLVILISDFFLGLYLGIQYQKRKQKIAWDEVLKRHKID